jgi:carbamate kinase
MDNKPQIAVVAVGGNSLIMDKPDVASQVGAVEETCKHIADMIARGWNVIVTHGNGPQVGFILRRNELAYPEVHSTPLDVIGADTQGAIGYMIARALDNEFKQRGIQRSVAAVVTQVLVDRNDPGFKNPTKGIGGFTTKDKADVFAQEGWTVKEDAGRGWRRMIASPIPRKIVEFDAQAKVVMCSALGQQALVQDAITAGARDFLIKPFNAARVVEVIAKVFNQVPTV